MRAEKIGMEAVKFAGSRTRGEGAEEMLDLCPHAVPQDDVMLIWSKKSRLIST
jgi:hypothetical protein